MDGSANTRLNYPKTKKNNTGYKLHGVYIADPYMWLEDSNSEEVKEWERSQNAFTNDHLRRIKIKEKLQKRLSDLLDIKMFGTPLPVQRKRGQKTRFIQWSYSGGKSFHDVYYRDGIESEPKLLLDGDKMSDGGRLQTSYFFPSNDGKFLAYAQSINGSDTLSIKIMDIYKQKTLDDVLPEILEHEGFNLVWSKNGFFYPSLFKDKLNYLRATVAFHELGTDGKNDTVVFENNVVSIHRIASDEDRKTMLMYGFEFDRSQNRFVPAWYCKKLKGDSKAKRLFIGDEWKGSKLFRKGKSLYALLKADCPNGRIVVADVLETGKKRLKTLIGESDVAINDFTVSGNRLVLCATKNLTSQISIYTLNGKLEHNVDLPVGAKVNFPVNSLKGKELFFYFESFTTPPNCVRYDIDKKRMEKISGYNAPSYDATRFSAKQIFYTSKDGTRIPMFIVHKKGLKLDAKNPVLLYGYGGFAKLELPTFSVFAVPFIEAGGVYAVANIRGGGEYGERWHKAGMLENKQNSFDDFIAASEYLIKKRYTNQGKLAIVGGSNGGLLVAACSVQRPDLYRAVLCDSPITDMLRYDKFDSAGAWSEEYGSASDPEQFKYLLKYSPLHNVKKGVRHPATLFVASESDDRVSPANARKMTALLQDTAGCNPILFKSYKMAGHGRGSVSTWINKHADMLAFVFDRLSIE